MWTEVLWSILQLGWDSGKNRGCFGYPCATRYTVYSVNPAIGRGFALLLPYSYMVPTISCAAAASLVN
jgi:hypothetical protein